LYYPLFHHWLCNEFSLLPVMTIMSQLAIIVKKWHTFAEINRKKEKAAKWLKNTTLTHKLTQHTRVRDGVKSVDSLSTQEKCCPFCNVCVCLVNCCVSVVWSIFGRREKRWERNWSIAERLSRYVVVTFVYCVVSHRLFDYFCYLVFFARCLSCLI